MTTMPVISAELPKLRPLGALERYMTTRSDLGIYNNVAVTAQYACRDIKDPKSALYSALARVLPQHPTLFAIPVNTDTPAPYFARLSSIDLETAVEFVDVDSICNELQQGSSPTLDRFLEKQHNCPFGYTTPLSPFWRIHVFQDRGDTSHVVLAFVFHHCLTDTKGAMEFLVAIEAALAIPEGGVLENNILSPTLPPPPPLDSFLENNSVDTHSMSSNGQSFGEWTGAKQFTPAQTRFLSHWLSAATTQQLVKASRQRSLPLTATLQAMLAAAIFRFLPEQYTLIKVDCPLSLRPWLPHPISSASMGCFIDNFCTEYLRSPFSWDEAQRAKDNIDQVILRKQGQGLCKKVAEIADLRAWFESKMGQARPSALELSNVGKFDTKPTSNDCRIGSVLFSQSAGACSGAIKVSTATGRDGRLSLGFTWQQGVVEDEMVTSLIDSLEIL